MNRNIALMLRQSTTLVAETFSDPNRPLNTTHEVFSVSKVTPLSETTAWVVYRKNTGKFAGAFFYYVNTRGGEWRYFFPTDAHLLGMTLLSQAKQKIEMANYGFNFANNEGEPYELQQHTP